LPSRPKTKKPQRTYPTEIPTAITLLLLPLVFGFGGVLGRAGSVLGWPWEVNGGDKALAVGEVLALQLLAISMNVRIEHLSYLLIRFETKRRRKIARK
jgi:hypothetical protein